MQKIKHLNKNKHFGKKLDHFEMVNMSILKNALRFQNLFLLDRLYEQRFVDITRLKEKSIFE